MNSLMGNRYEISAEISKGEMGDLFLAKDQMMGGRKVALKMVDGHAGNGHLETLKTEYALLSQLSHPNIVQIYDYGFDPARERFFFTEEFIDGLQLGNLIGKLPFEKIVQIAIQVLQALAHLHERGVVHGDLKPSNILVSGDLVKLVDFGLSRQWKDSDNRPTGGTLPYLAPEILSGGRVSPRSDLYSVGVLLFEISTGRLPFASHDFFSALRAHLLELPPHPCRVNPQLPPAWGEFLLKLLNKDPSDRPAEASQALRELSLALDLKVPVEAVPSRLMRLASLPLVGRGDVLDKICALLSQPDFFVAILQGLKGVGKTRLLSELKKRLERENPVFFDSAQSLVIPSGVRSGIVLADDFDTLSPSRQLEFLEKIKRCGLKLVVTATAWSSSVPLPHDTHARFLVEPLTETETAKILQKAFDADIPPSFVESVSRLTLRIPAHMIRLVDHLVDSYLIPFEAVSPQLAEIRMEDLYEKDDVMGFRPMGKSPYQSSLEKAVAIYEKLIREGKKEFEETLAELYYEQGEPEEVLKILRGSSIASPARSLLCAKALTKLGRFQESEASLVKLSGAGSLTPLERAGGEMGFGILSFYRGRNPEAIRFFLKARETFLNAGDPVHAAAADNSLGNVHLKLGQDKRALRFYHHALDRARQVMDVVGEGSYLMNLGNLHQQSGHYEKALESYSESLSRFKQIGYRLETPRVLVNLANTYLQIGNLLRAKELIHQAILMAQDKGLSYLDAYAKLIRGDIFSFEGNICQARTSYRSACGTFEGLGTGEEETLARIGLMRCAIEDDDLSSFDEGKESLKKKCDNPLPASVAEELLGIELASQCMQGRLMQAALVDAIKDFIKNKKRGSPQERAFLLLMERVAKRKKDAMALNWIALRLGRWVYTVDEKEKKKLSGRAGWEILKRLQAIHSLIVSGCPTGQVIEMILQQVLDISRADRGLLILKSGDSYHVDATHNLEAGVARELGNRISTTITSGVFSSGLPSVMGEVEASHPFVKSVFDLGLKSLLCLPLNVNGETIGVIYADSFKTQNYRRQLSVLQAFADLATVAIVHAKILGEVQAETTTLRKAPSALIEGARLAAII